LSKQWLCNPTEGYSTDKQYPPNFENLPMIHFI
jgi:hypothetical protein